MGCHADSRSVTFGHQNETQLWKERTENVVQGYDGTVINQIIRSKSD